MPKNPISKCPKCGSTDSHKNGRRLTVGGWRQKRQCKSCGHPWDGEIVAPLGQPIEEAENV